MAGKVQVHATGVKPKRASIEAVVTRADGTVEYLGEIAATEFTLAGKIKAFMKRIFAWN